MKFQRKKACFFIFMGILILLCAIMLLWPLPASLKDNRQAVSLRIFDRNGILLQERSLSDGNRGKWVKLAQISPHVIHTTIAVEDHRFYQHVGVDPLATARAMLQLLQSGKIVSGGSTITQQLARHVYRLPRLIWCKPLEWLLALRLEVALTKDEILESYLDFISYGNQAVGIEAAAQLYFGKPAQHLSLKESTYLVGLPQSPSRYNPYRHFENTKKRQEYVVSLLLKRSYVDSLEYERLVQTHIQFLPRSHQFRAPHFCDVIVQKVKETKNDTTDEIHTTLDWNLQRGIEILVQGHVARLHSENVTNAAALVIDNASGEICALVGSADYFNEEHDGQVNGCLALRQPGSTIKPFTYALALASGRTAADILPDIETHAVTEGGDFRIQNYDQTFHGPVRLRSALACSYNVPAVRVLEELGEDRLLRKLKSLGFENLNKPFSYYGLGLTLGNGEVTLLELTRAFCALANGGNLKEVKFVLEKHVSDLANDTANNFHQELNIFDLRIVYIITHILSDNEARAPAFGAFSPLNLPFECASKTGTSKDFRDNWTVGYTTRYTVGVWVGNFDGKAMRSVSGISGAGPLFRDIMLLLHRKRYPAPFARPAGIVEKTVCARSGELPNSFCPGTVQELFIEGTEPTTRCDVHRVAMVECAHNSDLEQRIYEEWPSLYHNWMEKHGLQRPLSLQQYSDIISFTDEDESDLVITFPDNGDIYKIDPVLRPEYQTLELETVVPSGINEISWWVDDSLYCRSQRPFAARWQLRHGKHTFLVKAEGASGDLLSKPVQIVVL